MTPMQPDTRREAGILLHPTSLPGPHGMGDIGASARRFLDWLSSAGLSLWQVLPLNPTGNFCPYVCWSALAGNPLLIDLAGLHESHLLTRAEIEAPTWPAGPIDYDAVTAFKEPRIALAAERLLAAPDHPLHHEYAAFRDREPWARSAALFAVLKRRHGGTAFWDWPEPLRDRDPSAIGDAEKDLAGDIETMAVSLFFFEHQWAKLRAYGHARGVRILGDLPIYVDRDSADVWSHRDLFSLDAQGLPTAVSGVPPDYFSKLGQLWGNPLYRWDRMAEDDFLWWRTRLSRALTHTDIVRIDHFRAFSAYWEVPFGAPDARTGRWVKGPGIGFFEALGRHCGKLPLVAEDLGLIDDEVIELRRAAQLPGMRVLQFAFSGDAANPHLPHNHEPDNVVYPGTHDNDTTSGWWQAAPAEAKGQARRYLGISGQDIAWDLIRTAFASVAKIAVISMQDVLALGTEARMNDPGTTRGNWRWKLQGDPFRKELAERLRELASLYGRLSPGPAP
jgi:4-alpha-glucanotransferase